MARVKKELTDAEKEKLARALSDFDGVHNFDVINPDEEYYYFFASKDPTHPQSVDAVERLGFEAVNRENNSGEQIPVGTVRDTEGGALQTNELVLTRIPKYLQEARTERMMQIAEERAGQTQEQFEEAVREAERGDKNVRVFIFGKGRS